MAAAQRLYSVFYFMELFSTVLHETCINISFVPWPILSTSPEIQESAKKL